MIIKNQVELSDAEIKQAIANFVEANGLSGASSQADSIVLKAVRNPAGYIATMDVVTDTNITTSSAKAATPEAEEVYVVNAVVEEQQELPHMDTTADAVIAEADALIEEVEQMEEKTVTPKSPLFS